MFDGNLLKDAAICENFIKFILKAMNENEIPDYVAISRMMLL